MRAPRSVLLLVLAAPLLAAGAHAQTAPSAKFPDWKGQWTRIGGVQWDPDKPRDKQQEPLTAEYEAIYRANLAEQHDGGVGGNPTFTCLPAGMPRVMTLVEPMEIMITPGVTYIIEYSTDAMNWQSATPAVTANASRVQWIDAGPPKTISARSMLRISA